MPMQDTRCEIYFTAENMRKRGNAERFDIAQRKLLFSFLCGFIRAFKFTTEKQRHKKSYIIHHRSYIIAITLHKKNVPHKRNAFLNYVTRMKLLSTQVEHKAETQCI